MEMVKLEYSPNHGRDKVFAPMMLDFAVLKFGKSDGEADGGPPLLKLRRTGVVQAMSGEAPR